MKAKSGPIVLVVIVFLISLILTACGGNATPARAAPTPDSNASAKKMVEYVGEIPETEFFVAIAVGSAGDVLAYVCDGMGIDYLFHGTAQANAVDLTSDVGQASLKANMQSQGFAGTFSVDGKTYSFTTVTAQDYGGLYHVTGLTEFEAEGVSQGGATLKMNLTPEKERVQIAIVTAKGGALSLDHPWLAGHDHREPTEYSESWLIFLNDGRARGGHIKKSLKPGTKHIEPICPP
jgi:hypothetical protein